MAREYKDSGIEWIGQIPKEWKVCRLKSFSMIVRGGSPRPIEDYISDSGYNWIKIGDTNKGNKYIVSVQQKIKEEGVSKTRIVHEGDLILTNSMSFGEPYILKIDGCIHDGWVAITQLRMVNKEFLYYSLCSPLCQNQFNLQVDGGVVKNLNVDKIAITSVLVPSLSTQQKIADYLDKVCGEVDEMVALQETMIEELKAYKQSVITEAVTKGLNPNAPMRNSGIDWIGEIPEHWGMPAIGYLAKITSGSTPDRNNPLFWSEGTVNWIKTGELQNNRLSCSEEKVTEYALNNTSIKLYPKDTILMAMYGQGKTRGMTALLDVPCTTNQACAALSIYNKNVNVLFLWKCLIGAYDAIRDKAVGTGQPNLNIDLISKFVIPLPPYNEQAEIVAFIDEIVPQIDSLIALKQAKIEELKEYKKSVIYEYVTGKKEVV